MESVKEEASKVLNKDKNDDHSISNWSDIVKDIVDKLTGKDMEVTYDFEDLEIDIPKATGPEGKELGSAKWKINGKFIISTQLHDTTKTVE
ncbi:MAG: hypothetical protein QOK59_07615 [Nitrososphaeraceae archaeon]|jgi:hypothetical protein|nr:hypothetical protein [Nitrososphaeraceae archaeon]MDW0137512.1 hypothetical protein [Nitrososphaeraceae archaeon]MDW0139742.1 hypothetical protein [Nitrososphaeraceae archaeon]MDW0146987.1 hypothetical protein [Nitrososphaeraceae archaeon]MDW0148533.1 hypothetical protein [Nitrososphaeraceae archaeon]